MTAAEIKIGEEYFVTHKRKGRYQARIDAIRGEWIDMTITAGRATALLSYNEVETGEQVTGRDSFCTFEPVPKNAQ